MKFQNTGQLPALAIKRTGTMVLLSSHSPLRKRTGSRNGDSSGRTPEEERSLLMEPGAPGRLMISLVSGVEDEWTPQNQSHRAALQIRAADIYTRK